MYPTIFNNLKWFHITVKFHDLFSLPQEVTLIHCSRSNASALTLSSIIKLTIVTTSLLPCRWNLVTSYKSMLNSTSLDFNYVKPYLIMLQFNFNYLCWMVCCMGREYPYNIWNSANPLYDVPRISYDVPCPSNDSLYPDPNSLYLWFLIAQDIKNLNS